MRDSCLTLSGFLDAGALQCGITALKPCRVNLNKDLFPLQSPLDPPTLQISAPQDAEHDGKQPVQMSCEE